MKVARTFARTVDAMNYRMGRFIMYGVFFMMGILLWSVTLLSSVVVLGWPTALPVNGPKMELTSIPDAEWQTVEDAAQVFLEEIAAESDTKHRVVDIFKKYNADMVKAGRPYRYG